MRNLPRASEDTSDTTHITSLVVHAQPGQAQRLSSSLSEFAEVDVHAADQNGKLVVLVETKTLGRVTELIEQINALDGVVGATLVYHQIEDSATLDQPVDVSGTRDGSAQPKEAAS